MEPHVPEQTTTTTTTALTVDDHDHGPPTNIIVKGKRTKRQRLQSSSIPFTILPQSNSTSNININPFNSSSPTSSSNFPAGSTTTEDEDTANCLILLSKSHNTNIIINNNHQFKFNSKRYIQTTTSDTINGFNPGIYVYECKTCSRTFPSFQALGGHRASHKKPRIINDIDKRRPPPYTVVSDEDEPLPAPPFPSRKNNSSSSSSLSIQLINTKKSSSNKLHECSICGTEFNSGQALGGHMRRHRVVATTTTSAAAATANTALSLIPYGAVATTMVVDDDDDDQDNYQKSRNDGLCLDLDLNLPAPPETAEGSSNQDHRRESSFKFTANSTKQQSAVHLSAAPTLVDCHY